MSAVDTAERVHPCDHLEGLALRVSTILRQEHNEGEPVRVGKGPTWQDGIRKMPDSVPRISDREHLIREWGCTYGIAYAVRLAEGGNLVTVDKEATGVALEAFAGYAGSIPPPVAFMPRAIEDEDEIELLLDPNSDAAVHLNGLMQTQFEDGAEIVSRNGVADQMCELARKLQLGAMVFRVSEGHRVRLSRTDAQEIADWLTRLEHECGVTAKDTRESSEYVSCMKSIERDEREAAAACAVRAQLIEQGVDIGPEGAAVPEGSHND
jgi:hypothetical protein